MQSTYEATVRLPTGYPERVTVRASTDYDAREMLEAQYGHGSVLVGPLSK